MPRRVRHELSEMAVSCSGVKLPAPGMSRSIRNLGIDRPQRGEFDERSFEQARWAQDTLVRTIALETVEGEVWDGDGEEV